MAEPVDQKTYLLNRIADLKRRRDKGAYGDDTPPDLNPAIDENISALRSVSPSYKEVMREDARRKHNERSFAWHIDREIEELKKRANILGISIF